MVVCELCGKSTDRPTTINVAGSNMQACSSCKGLGKSVEQENQGPTSHSFRYKKKQAAPSFDLVPNYSSMLNSALAKRGLNIQQLARGLNIRESTLNKYFTGKLKPDTETARKFERFFEISLLEQREAQDFEPLIVDEDEDESQSSMSLGDMLKKKLEESK